jgi:hypothetical protein
VAGDLISLQNLKKVTNGDSRQVTVEIFQIVPDLAADFVGKQKQSNLKEEQAGIEPVHREIVKFPQGRSIVFGLHVVRENQEGGHPEPGGGEAVVKLSGSDPFEIRVNDDQGWIETGGEPKGLFSVDCVDDLVSAFVEGESEIASPLVVCVRYQYAQGLSHGLVLQD